MGLWTVQTFELLLRAPPPFRKLQRRNPVPLQTLFQRPLRCKRGMGWGVCPTPAFMPPPSKVLWLACHAVSGPHTMHSGLQAIAVTGRPRRCVVHPPPLGGDCQPCQRILSVPTALCPVCTRQILPCNRFSKHQQPPLNPGANPR